KPLRSALLLPTQRTGFGRSSPCGFTQRSGLARCMPVQACLQPGSLQGPLDTETRERDSLAARQLSAVAPAPPSSASIFGVDLLLPRQPGLAHPVEETLQIRLMLEGQALALGRDREIGPRLERQGRVPARLLHPAELGMAGRDIGFVEGWPIGDPAVG